MISQPDNDNPETRINIVWNKEKENMNHLRYFVGGTIAGVAAATATVYGIYRYGFYSPRGSQNDDYRILIPMSEDQHNKSITMIDRLRARPYEHVHIRSYDGLSLSGRYYHLKDDAPLAILCHGYRGTPSRDFCGGADICFNMKLNVLLIEERAHCLSEGHVITFGVKERYDVLSWINYAVDRFGSNTKILLAGISMGGATVLMTSGLRLPQNVRGVLADCPFTSPAEMIMEFGRTRKLPMKIAYPMAGIAAKLFGDFSLKDADAVEAVKNTEVPILIIHGEADGLVPCEMSRRIAEANPEKISRYTFPGAAHGTSYITDTVRYTSLVEEFCKSIFK